MSQYDPPGGIGHGGPDAADRDTEEIRVEIEQTRTELSGTIDAIQQKLAPDVLTAQAKDIARDATDQAKAAAQEVLQEAVQEVKAAALEVTEHAVQEVKEAAREATVEAKDAAWDATVGRAEEAVSTAGDTARGVGSMVLETIKANPIPAALAGISFYWLYRSRASSPSTSVSAYGPPPYPTRQAYPVQPAYGTTTSQSRSQAGQGTLGAITETVGDAASQVGEVASDVASSAGRMASDAVGTAGQYATSARETALDTGTDIVRLIRQNPIPAALVGLGLSWLYVNRSSGGSDQRAHGRARYGYPPDDRYGTPASTSSLGGVGDLARQTGSQVSGLASEVTEQVGDLAEAAMDRTARAPGQIQRMINDNPLMTAALAASLGVAAGLMLPPTQTEDQLVGATRDRVMGKAQQTASQAVNKVESVAQEVQRTASREAQARGLTV